MKRRHCASMRSLNHGVRTSAWPEKVALSELTLHAQYACMEQLACPPDLKEEGAFAAGKPLCLFPIVYSHVYTCGRQATPSPNGRLTLPAEHLLRALGPICYSPSLKILQ